LAGSTRRRLRSSLAVLGTLNAWRVPGCLIQPASPSCLGSPYPRMTWRG